MRSALLAALALLGSASAASAASTVTAGQDPNDADIAITNADYVLGISDLADICAGTANTLVVTGTGRSDTPQDSPTSDPEASVFFRSAANDCTGSIPNSPYAGPETITYADFITNMTVVFPDDFGGVDTFTEVDLVNAMEPTVCDTDAGPFASIQKRLCLVVNYDNTDDSITKVDATGLTLGDFYTSAVFEIDTEAPPAPNTPEVQALDSGLDLTVSFDATGEIDDITQWVVRYRKSVSDGADCDAWAAPHQFGPIDTKAAGDSFQLSGLKNGVTYELCVAAIDNAGNVGGWSPVASGAPRDECDFIECFPGGAPTGHCDAAGTPVAALLAFAFLITRRRRPRLTEETR